MVARPGSESVFQLQDNQLRVEYKASNRLYRFVSVRRSSWNFKSNNYVADSRRRTKLKTVVKEHIIDYISNISSLPLDQLGYLFGCKSSLRNFVTILGSARNFDLSNYVADCRRRSKLKTTPMKNITIPFTSLLPLVRLPYLLWCKSYLGNSSMILGLLSSNFELNHDMDDCKESVKLEATPINTFRTQVRAMLFVDKRDIRNGANHLCQLSSHPEALPTTAPSHTGIAADDDDLAPRLDYSDLPARFGTPFFKNHYMQRTASIKPSFRPLYLLLLVLRSSRKFKLKDYVADCRRRSRLKNITIHHQSNSPTYNYPEVEIATDRPNNDALSYGTGVSHDASTANSEQTYSFNENRMKKHAESKLNLATSTTTIASQSRKMDEQNRLIEQLQKRVQAMQSDKSNDIDTNSASSREVDVLKRNFSATSDYDDDSDDDTSSIDSNTSYNAAKQESSQYEEFNEEDTSLKHRPSQDPPSHNAADEDSKSVDY
jgi:hypothetical protein